MGAGLAVVPLMGLLESIAVAKAFGKMPPASLAGFHLKPTVMHRVHLSVRVCFTCVYIYVYASRPSAVGGNVWPVFSSHERFPSEVFSVVTGFIVPSLQRLRITTASTPTRSCCPSVRPRRARLRPVELGRWW